MIKQSSSELTRICWDASPHMQYRMYQELIKKGNGFLCLKATQFSLAMQGWLKSCLGVSEAEVSNDLEVTISLATSKQTKLTTCDLITQLVTYDWWSLQTNITFRLLGPFDSHVPLDMLELPFYFCLIHTA